VLQHAAHEEGAALADRAFVDAERSGAMRADQVLDQGRQLAAGVAAAQLAAALGQLARQDAQPCQVKPGRERGLEQLDHPGAHLARVGRFAHVLTEQHDGHRGVARVALERREQAAERVAAQLGAHPEQLRVEGVEGLAHRLRLGHARLHGEARGRKRGRHRARGGRIRIQHEDAQA
jgi:hypothetical protein